MVSIASLLQRCSLTSRLGHNFPLFLFYLSPGKYKKNNDILSLSQEENLLFPPTICCHFWRTQCCEIKITFDKKNTNKNAAQNHLNMFESIWKLFWGKRGGYNWQKCKEDLKSKQFKQLIFGKRRKFLKSGEDKCKSLLSVSCLGSSGGSNLVQKTVFPSTTSSCPTLSDILATFFVPFYSQSLWSNNSLSLLVNQPGMWSNHTARF